MSNAKILLVIKACGQRLYLFTLQQATTDSEVLKYAKIRQSVILLTSLAWVKIMLPLSFCMSWHAPL